MLTRLGIKSNWSLNISLDLESGHEQRKFLVAI
jgi:hypothetical protein